MKYLCLIYDSEQQLDAMSPEEGAAFMDEYWKFTEQLIEQGQMLGGEQLQPIRSAVTVRVRDGHTSATDGPFAETTEQLGGFYIIEAGDLDEATRIAARIPSARTGSIEVRPVVEPEERPGDASATPSREVQVAGE